MFTSFMCMHSKILAQIYFLFGYLTSVSMFLSNELHLKFLGVFIASYLSYMIALQIEQKDV